MQNPYRVPLPDTLRIRKRKSRKRKRRNHSKTRVHFPQNFSQSHSNLPLNYEQYQIHSDDEGLSARRESKPKFEPKSS